MENVSNQSKHSRYDILWELTTALALSIAAAIALGLSRFAYGLLLPAMRVDLGWNYFEAGALNTANGAGYILGALITAWSAYRLGTARAFIIFYCLSVIVLFLTATTTSLSLLFSLRTVGGIATALTFILGAKLASSISSRPDPLWRGTLTGLYVAGVGIGMLIAGAIIPIILENQNGRWPQGWVVLGVMGIIGLPIVWWATCKISEPVGGSLAMLKGHEFAQLAPTFVGYGFFGAGYAGYMTFIIALLQSQGSSNEQTSSFWFILALASTVTTLLWGRVLGSFNDGRGAALVFAIAMLGTLPVLIYPGPTAMFISALLFGGSFLAGPTSIAIIAQRQLPAASWTPAIAFLTVSFSFGQTVGPILAGAISDVIGDVAAGFWVSPVLLTVAAVANLLQRPSEQGS